ncbi:MAG: ZIP family metal transporter [Methanobacteriaceae archaeon]|nr:ZIP family metal transporter [Methanobacteriaceae archaeon]
MEIKVMVENILFNPLAMVLIATGFTWLMTALGASSVFLTNKISRRLLDAALGFAAGVMVSVSFWGLLLPAVEMSANSGLPSWLPATSGFILGAVFLGLTDRILPHLHPGCPIDQAEGIQTTWKRNRLLILAMVLHHLPEGLAIGVAFAASTVAFTIPSITAAITLAIGIGIHNVPEGMIVAMPLRAEGKSPLRSFAYGQLSGMVEPVAALLGFSLIAISQPILPYALGFAAGSMIYVAIEELIPECQRGTNTDLATMFLILGFSLMMVLNVAFG